jgi:hypothetical protein
MKNISSATLYQLRASNIRGKPFGGGHFRPETASASHKRAKPSARWPLEGRLDGPPMGPAGLGWANPLIAPGNVTQA